jgi:KaiC/GvpD/RAD55 family RecA-like ATPase
MMNRVKTGVPGLDELMEGGFPEKSCILLIGPPGCGKSIMSQQFVYQGVKEKHPVIYVTLDTSPEEIMDNMKRFGWKIKEDKNLSFVDAYSWRVGKANQKYSISNLSNINELNIVISNIINEMDSSDIKRGVFDSVSTLLLYADPSLVVKLMPVIIAKIKKAGYTQILILEEGVHDEKTVSTLNYLTDGVIRFKMDEENRYLKIERMKATNHYTKWAKFKIGDDGLKVKK